MRSKTPTKPFTPAELIAATHEALKDESLGVAFEKARALLLDRERIALDLMSDGISEGKAAALKGAGYGVQICKRPQQVFGRLRVGLVIELGRRLKSAGREVTAESYRDDLLGLAHADPSDMYGDDGRILPLRAWPPALRRSIKSLKLDMGGRIESVTFEGRSAVLGLLGKHRLVGAFDQKRREARVYVIRDYTGARSELPAKLVDDVIEAELVEGIDDQADQADAPPPKLNGVLMAPGDLDVGSIPLSRQSRRPADAPAS